MNDMNQPPTYMEEVAQYTKKDGIHALLFFAFLLIVNVIPIPFLPTGFYLNLVYMSIELLILFVIIWKKGQGLRSAGIHLWDWKKAIVVGLIFAVIILMLFDGLLPGFLLGWQMRSATTVMRTIAYILFFAFYEDVIFIGFLQTRIYGLVKKDWLAIGIGALFFAVMHWPFFIRSAIESNDGFAFNILVSLTVLTAAWMFMHCLMNTIFRHLRSIIPVTLFHFAWNLASGNAQGGYG